MIEPRQHKTWTSVTTATSALFSDGFVYGVAVPLLPHSPAHIQTSGMLGLLFGAYALGVAAATPVCGALADKIGRRKPLLSGALLQLAAIVMMATGQSFPLLILARVLQGAAAASTWTAGLALVADNFAANRCRMMGIAMLGGTCGLVVGPIVGGLLFDWHGYVLPFGAAFAVSSADALARWFFAHDGGRSRPARGAALGPLLRDPAVRKASAVVILGAWCWSMLESLLPSHLEHTTAASPSAVGLVFTVSSLVYAVSCPLVGALAQRFGAHRIMPAGVAAMGMALPLLAVPHTISGAGAMLGLFGVAYGAAMNPTLSELGAAVDRQGSGAYASIYAIYNMAYSFGTVTSNVVTGALLSAFSLPVVFALTGVLLLSCLPVSVPASMWSAEPEGLGEKL